MSQNLIDPEEGFVFSDTMDVLLGRQIAQNLINMRGRGVLILSRYQLGSHSGKPVPGKQCFLGHEKSKTLSLPMSANAPKVAEGSGVLVDCGYCKTRDKRGPPR